MGNAMFYAVSYLAYSSGA